jgi:GT2 family glycosyltransferase
MTFDPRINGSISYNNRRGLPNVFNSHIVEENREKILAFTHDDVRIEDFWLSARLDEGLRAFDVIGVAGNRRRRPNQASWAFTAPGRWDMTESLSGAVAHLQGSSEAVSYYGPSKRKCKLLDGVLIAVRASVLIASGLRFDEQFDYHFYDLDFCRSAQSLGLTLGTWPIALTHVSGGSFESADWKRALHRYRLKWRD